MRRLCICLLMVPGALLCSAAEAEVRLWDGGGGDSDWFRAANWDPDGQPLSSDDLTVRAGSPQADPGEVVADGGGSITVESPSGSASIDQLYVGQDGVGTLSVLDGGRLISQHTCLGRYAGSEGTALVQGTGSSWTDTHQTTMVGFGGTGTLHVLDGGSVSASTTVIGWGPGQGFATVAGAGSTFNNSFRLSVGSGGRGTLDVRDGGSVFSDETLRIGGHTGSEGFVTVDGVGSSLTTNLRFQVGNAGYGTLEILNGATASGSAWIAHEEGSRGSLTIDGPGSRLDGRTLGVGARGIGTLAIRNGGAFAGHSVSISSGSSGGAVPGAQGTATIEGQGSSITATRLTVGRYTAPGELDVLDGATVSTSGLLEMGAAGEINLLDGGKIAVGTGHVLPDANALMFGAEASVESRWGATIRLAKADLLNGNTNPAAMAGLKNLALVSHSGPGRVATVEIAGRDRGTSWEAFHDNFTLGTLRVGGDAASAVRLADAFDNQPDAGGSDVLYVKNLIVSAGSQLDLDGHQVYCFNLDNDGSIVGKGGITEVSPITGGQAADCATRYEPEDATNGNLILEDTIDLELLSRDGPVTYPGVSLWMFAELGDDLSSDGRARATFQYGRFEVTDPLGAVLLDARLMDMQLDELADQPGSWLGTGRLLIEGGVLDEASAAPFGDVIRIRLEMESPDVDDFSAPFNAVSQITLLPIPEPSTLALLFTALIVLAACIRRQILGSRTAD